MSELLPCPFCGSPGALNFGSDGEVCNVRCSNFCLGTCVGAGPNSYHKEKAIAGWNRRAAAQAAQPEAVGWELVPIEPTPAMLVAMWDHRESMRGQSENRIARAGYAAMLASAPTPEPMSAPTAPAQAEPPRVTPYNVGRWCLSEDECISQGINFAAYERGVADAADAFGTNGYATPPTAASDATPPATAAGPSDAEPTEAQIDAYCEAWGAAFEAEEPEAFGVTVEPLSASLRRCIVAGLRAAIRATKGGKL